MVAAGVIRRRAVNSPSYQRLFAANQKLKAHANSHRQACGEKRVGGAVVDGVAGVRLGGEWQREHCAQKRAGAEELAGMGFPG
jgi:hypothetical protein